MDDTLEIVWTTQITTQEDRTRLIIPEEGEDDLLGTHGTPELRFVQQLSFTMGDWRLLYTGRYIDDTFLFTRNPNGSCFAENASASTRVLGGPNVYIDCTAESSYYSDLALTWTPDDSFSATFGISNVTDEQPARVQAGLGNDRGGRMTGAGYDQVGQSLFFAATYKF